MDIKKKCKDFLIHLVVFVVVLLGMGCAMHFFPHMPKTLEYVLVLALFWRATTPKAFKE